MEASSDGSGGRSAFEDDVPHDERNDHDISYSEHYPPQPPSSDGEMQIATQESKNVNRSKNLVYIVLTAFACVASVLVGWYVRAEENSEYENEFKVFADDILSGADSKADTIFREINTLASSITSEALDNPDQDWPFVTLPHFYIKSNQLGTISGAQIMLYTPIVNVSRKGEWEEYVQQHQQDILADTFGYLSGIDGPIQTNVKPIPNEFYQQSNLSLLEEDYFLPVLQFGPQASSSSLINLDLNSHPIIQRAIRDSYNVAHPILAEHIEDVGFLLGHRKDFETTVGDEASRPQSLIVQPVYDSFIESRSIVGFVVAVEPWEAYLEGHLSEHINGFVVDIHDTCGGDMTFIIHGGKDVDFLGYGDLHDARFDSLAQRGEFAEFSRFDGKQDNLRHCNYLLVVYPSGTFQDSYHSSDPFLFASLVFGVFFFTVTVFVIYDWNVSRRQAVVLNAAQRSTKIVKSLFPKDVGDRLMAEVEEKAKRNKTGKNVRLANFLSAGVTEDGLQEGKESIDPFSSAPLAEFYTDTTIMFADIVGFTAWSSTREPKQVFKLLETVYHEFDQQAKRRRVFKVETVGDCYVAVAGLPEPRVDHALAMARFARDCLYKFQALTHQLEVELGPDTADLSIRVGLHSGPVTAGVLRGDRARFQLFGDTVNTASRIESTGQPNRVHMSQETVDLLKAANKSHWCRRREDGVVAKGKGELTTFWLEVKSDGQKSSTSGSSSQKGKSKSILDPPNSPVVSGEQRKETKEGVDSAKLRLEADKESRLVKWNVEILIKILCDIKARRAANPEKKALDEFQIRRLEINALNQKGLVLDEVKEIIRLPTYHEAASHEVEQADRENTKVSEAVKQQLTDYVLTVASLYHSSNSFHNFEHASHVTMSIVKLLSRIIAPQESVDDEGKSIHDHSYGITSDPVTQFACALSGMIHDIDHTGVPNSQLIKEGLPIATTYKNRSVAEQNSVDLAWSLLMGDEYLELRRAIYCTEKDFKRFRQLVVNSVMATDIMDKDLGQDRKDRWARAFSDHYHEEDPRDTLNRKSTIVIEHLIQASDVAHTMQHFQIYKKWNERLFKEMYKAFKEGRAEKDPSEFWYEGEIGFFEFYIIPLAKKLKDCGVFGVSSDEYLNYALKNKNEWESRGKQLVEEFKEAALSQFGIEEGKT